MRARVRLSLLTAVLVGSGLATVVGPGASAVTPCGAGGAFSASPSTCSYTSVGSDTFTVPTGVTSIDVDVRGAQGGVGIPDTAGDAVSSPGLGGETTATLAVTAGQTLNLTVGGAGGTPTGGAGGSDTGGGNGGSPQCCPRTPGGGGGASDVRSSGGTLADRLVVAGGGGGGGASYAIFAGGAGGAGGGSSGAAGGTGVPTGTTGGGGGTQIGPGGGGSAGNTGTGTDANGDPGNSGGGRGGDGHTNYYGAGAGGGGGYFGGGGGGTGYVSGGGGGGSGFADPSTTNAVLSSGVESGDGTVTITWKVDQAISFTSTAPSSAVFNGPTYSVSATGGGSGNPVVITADAASAGICSISGATVSFTGVGLCVLDANQAGNANYNTAPQAQQSFSVNKAAQTVLFTSTAPTSEFVGGPYYTPSATGGGSGNPVVITVDGGSSGFCTMTGANVSFTAKGTCVLDANQAGDANYFAAPQAQQSFAVSDAPTANVPSVSVTAGPASAAEGGLDGAFVFTRTGDTSSALTVTYSTAGSAISGVDFSPLATVVIPAGQPSVTVPVHALADSPDDNGEATTVQLTPNNSYNLGSPESAAVAIVESRPACDKAPISSYTDRADASVHAHNVDCLTAYGLAEGFSDNTYRPALDVSRA
jgi:hypothetical protein